MPLAPPGVPWCCVACSLTEIWFVVSTTESSGHGPLGELGDFLRSRRSRLRPNDVSLPVGARRLTPGLRREEVAQLSGPSHTYYTYLEQGRDVHPSAQVRDAVARTLRLSPAERDHLYVLAHGVNLDALLRLAATVPEV
jgi:hypothetical protein